MFRTTHSRTISLLCGVVVSALSVITLPIWKSGYSQLNRLPSSWELTDIPTAICFLFSGSALIGHTLLPRRYRLSVKRVCVFFILLIAGIGGLELIVNIPLDLNSAVYKWFGLRDSFIERMSGTTLLSFILVSLGLLLHERIQYSLTGLRLITGALFTIAMCAAVNTGLNLEYLYSWIHIIHMPVFSAIGMLILSLGLWSLWVDAAASRLSRQKKEEQGILRRATLMIVVAIFSAGLIGFGLLRLYVEYALSTHFDHLAADRRLLFYETLQQGLKHSRIAQKHLLIQEMIPALEMPLSYTKIRQSLQEAFVSLSEDGFTALGLEQDGKIIVKAGEWPSPFYAASLNTSHAEQAQLIWQQGHYFLKVSSLLYKEGCCKNLSSTLMLNRKMQPYNNMPTLSASYHTPVKLSSEKYQTKTYLVSYQRLYLSKQWEATSGILGKSAKIMVCAHNRPSAFFCFPIYEVPSRYMQAVLHKDQAKFIKQALNSQSGMALSREKQGKPVILAYGPVGSLGLGMAVKMDMEEMYLPVKERLHTMLPWILGLIAVGLWWIRKSIYPLVTTMVRSRQQLEESLKWRSALLESAAVSVISTNHAGVISSFNKAAQRMLGYTEVEMVNHQTLAVFHDDNEIKIYAAELENEIGQAIAPGVEAIVAKARLGLRNEREWTYLRKDGTRLSVSLAVTALYNPEGAILGFLCIAYDLTERKRVEVLKNEFIATVSHELRTPLTSIRGSLSLLASGMIKDIPLQAMKLLTIANTNCERLIRLINDFLDIEKIEAGNMHFNYVVQPLIPIVEQGMQAMQSFAVECQVSFKLCADEDLGYVNVDADRLSQVIINLLSNAAKFATPGSHVDIMVSQHDDRVRFAVTNYGKGIPEAYRKHIFDKFIQVNESQVKQHRGTGLGLSISKTIIEKHFGTINFRSEVDQFTEFFFELPVASVSM